MSNSDEQIIKVEELSDFNKWLEVLSYSEGTYMMMRTKEARGYMDLYQKAEELTKGALGWIKIFEMLGEGLYYEDWDKQAEIFVRFVEAHYKTQVKDGKHLEGLTGTKQNQYHKDFLADFETGLDGLVLSAKNFRYEIYLYYLLSVTKSYKELTKINPSGFDLPKKWILYRNKDKTRTKKTMILNTLGYKFNLWEVELMSPPLRDVAKFIEAPYSVILEASINSGSV